MITENEKLKTENNYLNLQLVKYTELHAEEKSERKETVGKYESLQKEMSTVMEGHNKERLRFQRNYFSLILLSILLAILLMLF